MTSSTGATRAHLGAGELVGPPAASAARPPRAPPERAATGRGGTCTRSRWRRAAREDGRNTVCSRARWCPAGAGTAWTQPVDDDPGAQRRADEGRRGPDVHRDADQDRCRCCCHWTIEKRSRIGHHGVRGDPMQRTSPKPEFQVGVLSLNTKARLTIAAAWVVATVGIVIIESAIVLPSFVDVLVAASGCGRAGVGSIFRRAGGPREGHAGLGRLGRDLAVRPGRLPRGLRCREPERRDLHLAGNPGHGPARCRGTPGLGKGHRFVDSRRDPSRGVFA